MSEIVLNTDFNDLKLLNRGKVRDIYDLGKYLLIVTTDRISAFDVVMNEGIPDKGKVLTKISVFWFNFLKDIIPNHLVSSDAASFPAKCKPYLSILKDRSMLVEKCKTIAVECIARGYLSGSGWNEYRKKQSVCGIKLPAGLKESSKLPATIFTPSTKEEVGVHDENMTFEQAVKKIGVEKAEKIKDATVRLYEKARNYAFGKGIIIADTKFEFGIQENGGIILIDEALTPDSSRFWPLEDYKEGRGQKSFDKQFLRDYLLSINWDKKPPAPALPEKIIRKTADKYKEALLILTGERV